MIRKGFLITIGIFIFIAGAESQHLSHQVLVPAAGVVAGGGMNYSQTMGETAVEIVGCIDHVLTQGFQQPRVRFKVGPAPQGSGIEVYPNPVVQYVNVELYGESSKTFIISVININGTKVYSDEISFPDKYWEVVEIPLSGFATGLYFVRIYSTDRVFDRSFKIEKM